MITTIVITVTMPAAERMIRTIQIQRNTLFEPLWLDELSEDGLGLGVLVKPLFGEVDGLVDGAGLKVGFAEELAFGVAVGA